MASIPLVQDRVHLAPEIFRQCRRIPEAVWLDGSPPVPMAALPTPARSGTRPLPCRTCVVEARQPLAVRDVQGRRAARPVRTPRNTFGPHHDELHPMPGFVHERRFAAKIERAVESRIAVGHRHRDRVPIPDSHRKAGVERSRRGHVHRPAVSCPSAAWRLGRGRGPPPPLTGHIHHGHSRGGPRGVFRRPGRAPPRATGWRSITPPSCRRPMSTSSSPCRRQSPGWRSKSQARFRHPLPRRRRDPANHLRRPVDCGDQPERHGEPRQRTRFSARLQTSCQGEGGA